MSRYSVIDVGSNTIHLLVGEVDGGVVLPVASEKITARLGSGVSEAGRIEEGRLALAAEAVKLYARVAALNNSARPVVLATSAVRDAENGGELVEIVREATGLKVRLLSGEEEAVLGFRGALSALGAPWDRRALVVDLGGGSVQLALGRAADGPERWVSLPLGTNRMTERFVCGDPASDRELSALSEAVAGMLPDWDTRRAEVVAVGGSARALLKIALGEPTVERLRQLSKEIRRYPSAAFAREKGLAPERARLLPTAITVLVALLERFERPELTVARGGLREGALLALAEGKEI